MDANPDQTHVFRFREIHFDGHWRPRMYGSGVAYALARQGGEATVVVVAADDTRIRRSYGSGQILVFDDVVHLPPVDDDSTTNS